MFVEYELCARHWRDSKDKKNMVSAIPEHSRTFHWGNQTTGKSHIKETITCHVKCHEATLKGEEIESERDGVCWRRAVRASSLTRQLGFHPQVRKEPSN